MTDTKGKVTTGGPSLPKDLGENVNGGFSVNDPQGLEWHAGGGANEDTVRRPPRVRLDEETGEVYTDAPKPVVAPPRKERKVTLSDGPKIDPTTGGYLPAMYKTKRIIKKKDGSTATTVTIRKDN